MEKEGANQEFMQHVWKSYQQTNSLQKTADNLGIAYAKVRKILITLGKYETEFSETVAKKRLAGKSIQEIAVDLKTTTNRVNAFLPYEKTLYDAPEQTLDAKKSNIYRKRIRVAQEKFVNKKMVCNKIMSSKQETNMKENLEGVPKKITAVHLHLELKDEYLDEGQMRMLKRYGESKTGNSIIRDILIPSDMTLHNLHYAIQRLFGWQNSHLRKFHLREDDYQKVTGGTVKGWSDLVGILFQAPSESEGDIFWDDDYKSGSIKAWLKKKYTGPYVYGGFMEEADVARREIKALLNHYSLVDVRESFQSYHERTKGRGGEGYRILRQAPLVELTLDEMIASVYIDGNTDHLLERLEVAAVLASSDNELPDNGYFPLAREIIYNYDFGDNWEVFVTRGDDGRTLIENGDISIEELKEAVETVTSKHIPVCVYKEGINVLDDVGGLHGFADFLARIYESENQQESAEYRAWAQTLGWSARKVSNKTML